MKTLLISKSVVLAVVFILEKLASLDKTKIAADGYTYIIIRLYSKSTKCHTIRLPVAGSNLTEKPVKMKTLPTRKASKCFCANSMRVFLCFSYF